MTRAFFLYTADQLCSWSLATGGAIAGHRLPGVPRRQIGKTLFSQIDVASSGNGKTIFIWENNIYLEYSVVIAHSLSCVSSSAVYAPLYLLSSQLSSTTEAKPPRFRCREDVRNRRCLAYHCVCSGCSICSNRSIAW